MPVNSFSSERAAINSGRTRGLLDRAELVRAPRLSTSGVNGNRQIRYPVELLSLGHRQETRIEPVVGNKLLIRTKFLRTQHETFGVRAITMAGIDPGGVQTESSLYLAPVHNEGTYSGDIFLLTDPPLRRDGQPSSELVLHLPISNWPMEELDDQVLQTALLRSLEASRQALAYAPYNPLEGWVQLTYDSRLPQGTRRLLEAEMDPAKWVKLSDAERLAAIKA